MKAAEVSWITGVRVRPGFHGRLVDLSSGGVLIELRARLSPGAPVTVLLVGETGCALSGGVARAFVARVDADGVCYRVAVAFTAPGRPARVDPTRDE